MSAVPDSQELIQVEDLNQFVYHLNNWHQSKVAMLRHMLQIPEGTAAELNDGEKVTMTGDILRGFRIGVTLGLSELGTLPFVAEMTDSAEAPKH